jgi:hypothetical protein
MTPSAEPWVLRGGTDRYDNCRMTLKENRNGVVTVRVER